MKDRLEVHGAFSAIGTPQPALQLFECVHAGGAVQFIS
jgi:hypothetical protein